MLQKSHKFEYNDQEDKGKTILHYACENGNFDLAQTIASLGAITTIKDNTSMTILHYACQNGNFEIVYYLIERSEFNINEKDARGMTPYNCAYKSENIKLIQYLEGLPGIDKSEPKEEEPKENKKNPNNDVLNEENNEKSYTKSSSSKKMKLKKEENKDEKAQSEYGKMYFMKAIKYLRLSRENGSIESSEFITKYIKDTEIEEDQIEEDDSF